MNWSTGGKWNDLPVSGAQLGIAEWVADTGPGPGPGGSVPEPTTLALLGLGLAATGFARKKRVG